MHIHTVHRMKIKEVFGPNDLSGHEATPLVFEDCFFVATLIFRNSALWASDFVLVRRPHLSRSSPPVHDGIRMMLLLLVFLCVALSLGHTSPDAGSVPVPTAKPKKQGRLATPNERFLMAVQQGVPKWPVAAVRRLLDEKGASLFARDEQNGFSALHWAANNGRDINNYPLWTFLTSRMREEMGGGDFIHALDGEGATPLHRAAINNNLAIAEYLIQEGANLDAADNHGFTPLCHALRHGRVETARMLLDAGADPHVVTKAGLTPLTIARHFVGEEPQLQGLLRELEARPAAAAAPKADL